MFFSPIVSIFTNEDQFKFKKLFTTEKGNFYFSAFYKNYIIFYCYININKDFSNVIKK